jgi:hypothetical protein
MDSTKTVCYYAITDENGKMGIAIDHDVAFYGWLDNVNLPHRFESPVVLSNGDWKRRKDGSFVTEPMPGFMGYVNLTFEEWKLITPRSEYKKMSFDQFMETLNAKKAWKIGMQGVRA